MDRVVKVRLQALLHGGQVPLLIFRLLFTVLLEYQYWVFLSVLAFVLVIK